MEPRLGVLCLGRRSTRTATRCGRGPQLAQIALGLHPLMDELLFMLSLSNNHNPFSVVRFIGHAFSPEASNKYYKFLFVRDFYTFENMVIFYNTLFKPWTKR